MRLVSQNGNVDIPYEQAHILCNMECVMARVGNYEYTLGKYSDKAKALKVIEMLRETYLSRMELEGGYDIVNGCYVQPNYWVLPKVFKFPDDSEVEVQDE